MTEMKKAHSLLARYRVHMPDRYLALLEPTHDPVRIRGTLYRRYTWRGVPGRLCDVIVANALVQHRALSPNSGLVLDVTEHRAHKLPPALEETAALDETNPDDTTVIEIGSKIGRYDGAQRRRYVLRVITDKNQLKDIGLADVRVLEQEDEIMIVIRPRDGTPIVDTFRRLRGNLDGYDLKKIVMWHGRRYYTHLDYKNEIVPAACAWADGVAATGESASWTLAEANRSASRFLYHLSRELGWRKLTQREKTRLFLPPESPQWRRIEGLLPRYAALAGNQFGISEGTIDAASGHGESFCEPLEVELEE